MSRRHIAASIIALRALLIAGLIARLMDDDEADARTSAEFTKLAMSLPVRVLRDGGLTRYVSNPAARTIERTGILAHADRSTKP